LSDVYFHGSRSFAIALILIKSITTKVTLLTCWVTWRCCSGWRV